MFKTGVLITSLLLSTLVMSSCYQCVECTGCTDPEKDMEEICYKEGRPYYRNRQEWREDVKSYEKVNGCDCK